MDTLLKEKLINCEVGATFELYFVTFVFAGMARFEVVGEKTCQWEKNGADTWVFSLSGKDKFYGGDRYVLKRMRCYYFELDEEKFNTITIYEDKTVTLWGERAKTQEVLLIDPATKGAEEMVLEIKNAKAVSVGMVAMLYNTYNPSRKLISDKLTKLRSEMKSLEADIKEAEKILDAKNQEWGKHVRDANVAFFSVIEEANSKYMKDRRSKRQCIESSDD